MRILIQNVLTAQVVIAEQLTGSINRGWVLFVGFNKGDDRATVEMMIDKLLSLRIFPDGEGKTNLSIDQIDGEILSISQFTLYADVAKGRRPSFTSVLDRPTSIDLYDYFNRRLSVLYRPVVTGVFGADMQVTLTNDGPFTLMLDSEELRHG